MATSVICTSRSAAQYLTVILFVTLLPPLHAKWVTNKNIGVTFSPLVRKGDTYNAQTYTTEILKVMLDTVLNAGYSSVTTYGVGSPYRVYDNQSFYCSSFIHTALAAAEINRSRNYLAISVYQGMFNSTFEDQVSCEIDVGLEVALHANRLFNGSVPAVVYPSRVSFNDLMDSQYINAKIRNVSARAHALHIKYGARVTDCESILTRDWSKVKNVLSYCDFIICLEIPDENQFKFGWEDFKSSAKFTVLQVEELLKNKANITSKSVELILETGWPGDTALRSPNTVKDLIAYWNDLTAWSVKHEKKLFLHEAFDTPWKNVLSGRTLEGQFGRWKYNTNEPNLLSADAYILKQDYEQSFLSSFGWTLLGILLGIFALVAVITMMTLLYKRMRRIEKVASSAVKMSVKENSENIWDIYLFDSQHGIQKNKIKIDKTDAGLLGDGHFGCVYKGEIFLSDDQQLNVAVKMTRLGCTESAIKSIFTEVNTLMFLGINKYICNILGAYTREMSKGIVYFAMELCTLGNLGSYLQENKSQFEHDLETARGPIYVTYAEAGAFTLSEIQLVRWSYEIASAMKFISSKNVIHSDLAARNVLLTAEFTTKVSDFGLSRRFMDDNPLYIKEGNDPVPWKSLSPESLELKIFSTKSDVWAYGVTMWELFSLGSSPQYDSISTWNELICHFKTGKRLERPEYASEEIFSIMTQCWQMKPSNRPSFEQLLRSLFLLIDSNYLNLTE